MTKGPFTDLLERGLVKAAPDYSGALADAYDAIEGRRQEDLPFYRQTLSTPGHVIDLGCGTGRVTRELLAIGHRVTAIDNSPSMLQILRDRLEHQNLTVLEAGMESFAVEEAADAIVISYNSFYNMNTSELRSACVSCCRRHLKPGGLLIIDVDLLVPQSVQSGFYSQVVPHTDGSTNVFVDFADMNQDTGLRETQYLCLTLRPDGTYTGTLTNSSDFIPRPPEIKNLLLDNGFTIDRFLADYEGTRLKEAREKTKLVAVARAEG